MSRQQIGVLDATPNKKIFLSIIADYGLDTGICELIDNAYDSWNVPSKGQSLLVEITADYEQQKITVRDNAGGVPENKMDHLISPGATSTTGDDPTIGAFGVGSKRAAVALSQLVRISSRYKKLGTYQIEYDDDWLKNDDWHIGIFRVDQIAPSSTIVELSNLRVQLTEDKVANLREKLSTTYARLMRTRQFEIKLNGSPITPKMFDDWAFPEEAPPKCFFKRITNSISGHTVNFRITGGLTVSGGSIGGEYGVYVYCNGRMIGRALRDKELGFITHLAGIPNPRMSLARIILEFEGPSGELPWTSSKSGINYNHWVFGAIQQDVFQVVTTYAKISKNLQPDFEERVRPFTVGNVAAEKLERKAVITPGRLPKIPTLRPNFKDTMSDLNSAVVQNHPYTRGLYEAIIAERLIFKQRSLEQRNRICLIILDSTVEIALKDYLSNVSNQQYSDARLEQLFANRILVQREVESQILQNDNIWKKLTYFYRQRCDLIHRRANSNISDSSIEDFRLVVQKLLNKMFKLKFPAN